MLPTLLMIVTATGILAGSAGGGEIDRFPSGSSGADVVPPARGQGIFRAHELGSTTTSILPSPLDRF
jgi:hypothetical protein